MMRRYPRDNGPAALPLFCLAPHGVFRASQITPRAVSPYLAFSTLPSDCGLRIADRGKKNSPVSGLRFPLSQGGMFSVTLSVNAPLPVRRPRVLRGMLPCGVRTFLQQASRLTSDHLPSRGSYPRLPLSAMLGLIAPADRRAGRDARRLGQINVFWIATEPLDLEGEIAVMRSVRRSTRRAR